MDSYIPNEELNKFLREIVVSEEKEARLFFMFKKWSAEEPYWCLFACQDNEDKIGGHYCLERDTNLEQVRNYFEQKSYRYIV